MRIWNAGIPRNAYVSSGLDVVERRKGRWKEKREREKSGCAYIPWYPSFSPPGTPLPAPQDAHTSTDNMHTSAEDAHIALQEDPSSIPVSPPVKLDSAFGSPVLHASHSVTAPIAVPVSVPDPITIPVTVPVPVASSSISPGPIRPGSSDSDSDSCLLLLALIPKMSSLSAAPSIIQSMLTLDTLLCWVDNCLIYFGIHQISASEQVSWIIYIIHVTCMRPWLRSNHSQLCALPFDEFVMEIKMKWLKSDWKNNLVKRVKNDQPSGLDFLDWVTKLIEANESISSDHSEFVNDLKFKSHIEAIMSEELHWEYRHRDGEQKTLSNMEDMEVWIDTVHNIEDRLSSERKWWISALVQHINENHLGPGPLCPSPPSLPSPATATPMGPHLCPGNVWYNIPPLTDNQWDLLRLNRGCFKCREFFASHFQINCPATHPLQDAVANCMPEGLQCALQNRNSNTMPAISTS